jgi:predicted TIM-barrel fold metal-dependent hydrolase
MNVNEPTRRDFLRRGSVLAGAVATSRLFASEQPIADPPQIIDSHVHVWDLDQFHLPWLGHNPSLLNRNYSVADYVEAAKGLNITGAVYVEVNVEPGQEEREARYAIDLCVATAGPFVAGVVGGDPRDTKFPAYLDQFKDSRAIRGVRFHYPAGASADPAFIRGLRELGNRGLSFDLQVGSAGLLDAAKAVQLCKDTQFVLNHCGGGEPSIFRATSAHDPASRRSRKEWQDGITALARQPNVACKISGVADLALPDEATAQDIAPVVTFCLDQFGPDRVLFGGNWPVCLKGTTLKHWVESLRHVVSRRSEEDRRKLFRANAERVYRLAELRTILHKA